MITSVQKLNNVCLTNKLVPTDILLNNFIKVLPTTIDADPIPYFTEKIDFKTTNKHGLMIFSIYNKTLKYT